MRTVHLLSSMAWLFVVASIGWAQSPTLTDFNALKNEVAQLRHQVEGLKKELAILKPGLLNRKKVNLPVRFEAAINLNNYSEQQSALEGLAIESARQGDVKYTKDCLDKISNYGPKQTATYKSSLLLAAAGLEKEGLELAKTLGDFTTRNKALLKIAKGEVED